MSEQELWGTLAAVRQMRARADALEARALARLCRLRGGDRWLAREVALELRISPRQAQARLERGVALVGRLPGVLGAMEAGEIEGYTAGRLVEATAMLEDPQARQVDAELAEKLATGRVGSFDPTGLVQATRRLVEKTDPEGQTARARRARAGRRVELIHGEHATATLAADLPAELAASCYARLDALARRLRRHDPHRTLDQLRADICADLLLGRDPGVTAPAAAATAFLHLPVDTALTMSEQGCELAGYGPIPAPIAREIMTNPASTWRAVLTDPATGAPVDLGRRRRRPSALIRDLVAVRDRECATPGCHRPAQRSDFDHLTPWTRNHGHGPTTTGNGGAKCRRCHQLKDHPHWKLHHNPTTGTSTITTPTGRHYTQHRHTITTPTHHPSDPPTPQPPQQRTGNPPNTGPPF
ncbi:HNH endonuclease, partial [Qaidamihabitans albus]|uniref:HNH endonuclease n=1 Tax=Qaidamihabitans albus TaxID=2795733 RepID=UPI0018F25427